MRSSPCPRQQMVPTVLCLFTNRVSCAVLPVVLAVIVLPAVAFASPPDPSWIAGIYDGADGDDIVSLIYETSAASTAVPSQVGPLPCLLEMYLDDIARYVPDRHFTRGPRSPPVLRSSRSFNSLLPPPSFTDVPVTLPSLFNFCPSPCCDPKMKGLSQCFEQLA